MKNLLFVLLVFLPHMIYAYDAEIDGIYYNIIKKGKIAEVTFGDNVYGGSIIIPETVEYEGVICNVTTIGVYAFKNSTITSVTIPSSVTTIEIGAFYDCSCLTSIILPESVTTIKKSAFSGCSSLRSVTIPSSMTTIEEWAFSGCLELDSVHITDLASWCSINFAKSSNPLEMDGHLFMNGEEIKDLIIPNTLTSIGNYAFSGCIGLTSVTIPNSVATIGEGAFGYCYGLTSVIIPESVTTIGKDAFFRCERLTSISIPNSVTTIGEGAFRDCYGLTSVIIPESVTTINGSLFFYCEGLTSVTIPNSVIAIGDYAFSNCNLKAITIPNAVTSIGNRAFANNEDIEDVYCLAETVPSRIWDNFFEGDYLEYVTLHVPASAIEAYRITEPWSLFGNIVALQGNDNPEVKQCAVPTITIAGEKLKFTSETEGATVFYDIKLNGAHSGSTTTGDIEYAPEITITAYATAEGYDQSETTTLVIMPGDMNGDGKITVEDVTKLVQMALVQE